MMVCADKFASGRATRWLAFGGLAISTLLSGAGLGSNANAQQPWPAHQVTIVVPYPPGGSLDVAARILADGLGARTGQNFVVLDRPGGNGQVALGDVSRAAPDGYTLLVNNEGGICVQAVFDPNFHFDPSKAYTPLAQIVSSTYILAIRGNFPAETLQDFIEAAKKAPSPVTFGSPGIGTTPQIGMEYFARRAGIGMLHVPYSGTGSALNDLVGGRIDALMSGIANVADLAKTGRIRILAVMSSQRDPLLPAVPTMAEGGLPNFTVPGWLGLFAPPNMAPELRARISKAVADTVRDPAYAEKLRRISTQPIPMESVEFARFYASELAKWRAFAAETHIKASQ